MLRNDQPTVTAEAAADTTKKKEPNKLEKWLSNAAHKTGKFFHDGAHKLSACVHGNKKEAAAAKNETTPTAEPPRPSGP